MPHYPNSVTRRFLNKSGLGLLITLCMAFALASPDCLADRKKRILVLHSYHQGLEWTDNITKGIQSVFLPYQSQFEINYEYLDTKRNSGREYMDTMLKFISKKNEHIEYDVIVVSDNNALKLINDGSIAFKGAPPVVFCGINNYTDGLISGIEQATGVVEKTDHRATIDLMHKLHPKRNRVVVIIDNTPTGDAIREEFRVIENSNEEQLEFIFWRDFLLAEIPGLLATLGDDNLIYVTTFNRDRENNFISYSEGIELISRYTKVPVYGSWDFYLGRGIVGGKITSGRLQGEQAGKLALEILSGHQATELPIFTDNPNQYMFDYNYLEKYNIDKSSLPARSQIINSPPTTYERYRTLLVIVTILSLCTAVIIMWKFKRQQSILVAKQALALELEIKVRDRTKELERANKELQRLSNLDGLTQIYNRRYFDNTLKTELNRLQRSATPISLVLCDIDAFKIYNDTYGHLAGDDCIRSIAATVQKYCKRSSDVAARYGGEEFAMILPNTGPMQAMAIAESLRRAIEQKMIPHKHASMKNVVTLSFGVASIIPDHHTTPSMLIELADKALYESKRGGRNRSTLKTA